VAENPSRARRFAGEAITVTNKSLTDFTGEALARAKVGAEVRAKARPLRIAIAGGKGGTGKAKKASSVASVVSHK